MEARLLYKTARGMGSVVQIAQALNTVDTQAGVVGDGDLPLVEHRAAQNGVLAAQHGTVQVDLGDDLLGAGQMDRRVDADLGLQHAADHALHAVDLGGGGDFQGVIQAAALHQLDVHHVCGAHLHDLQSVLRGEHALVGQNGDVGALSDVLQALKVVGLDGLLHEFDVQALVLHLVEQLDGLLGAPGLVGIDADANVVAYLSADRHETGHIQRGIGAHLDLQGVIAAVYCVAGVTGHLFGGIDADGDVGDNLGAATPRSLYTMVRSPCIGL